MSRQHGITKVGGQKHALDKFYTKSSIAKECINLLDLSRYDKIIEPSAGSGSFSLQIANSIAYDVDPEHPSIIKKDWFSVEEKRTAGRTLVIGNPPFGVQNVTAVSFINHAAKFADTIAFILPLSFMKESRQKRIDKNFHLRSSLILPRYAFELDNKNIHVASAFQIWDYDGENLRTETPNPQSKGFSFVKKSAAPDLYIQRVGYGAGVAGVNWVDRNEQSHYFIKLHPEAPDTPEQFVEKMNVVNFDVRDYSVGPRSLSRKEMMTGFLRMYPEYLTI